MQQMYGQLFPMHEHVSCDRESLFYFIINHAMYHRIFGKLR